MPVQRLTKTGINDLALPTQGNQILYSDPEQSGFAVRVTTGGARSFVVDKNTKRGRIRITLGEAGTDALTIAQAREKARIALGLIAEGYTADQVKERLSRSENRIPDGAVTLQQVLEQCLAERKHKLAERTKADYQELLDKYLADWKDRPLETINESAVVSKFTSIDSPSRANYTFRVVRMLFNYARSIRDDDDKPIVSSNPVDILSQRRLWHADRARRDVIELAALKPWWKAVKILQTNATYDNVDSVRDWLMFMLLTGLRRTEAAELRWENVDLRSKFFTITTTKNREPHTLPLSDYLYAMLKRRHAAMLKENLPGSGKVFVFPGLDGPIAEPQKLLAKVVQTSGVKFSPHTLRRTFASVAESLDIPYLALKRLLNHKMQDVTAVHYTVINVERLRKPMQKIEDFILRAAGERRSAAVVKMKRQSMARIRAGQAGAETPTAPDHNAT
jgi:integrase